MVKLGITAKQQKYLQDRMAILGLRKCDVQENFIRSSGPGGQHINKTATCVHLKHLPTGIEVKEHRQRAQAINRLKAWELLLDKIELSKQNLADAEKASLEKLRRQKRKKPQDLKEWILKQKKIRAQKKSLRQKIQYINEY